MTVSSEMRLKRRRWEGKRGKRGNKRRGGSFFFLSPAWGSPLDFIRGDVHDLILFASFSFSSFLLLSSLRFSILSSLHFCIFLPLLLFSSLLFSFLLFSTFIFSSLLF